MRRRSFLALTASLPLLPLARATTAQTPVAVDGDTGFEEEPAVEPVAEFRTEDGGPRVFVCGGEELGEGIRLGGAVVVD